MKLLIATRETNFYGHQFRDEHLEQIKRVVPDWDIVVTSDEKKVAQEKVDADVIVGYPATIPEVSSDMQVKWVHSFSAGVDRVLTPEVKGNKNIVVSNSSGIHATPIAEHILGFMLVHTRNFKQSFENQQQHVWGKGQALDNSMTELRNKTVLVVGMGEIGGEVARLSAAFGCKVVGVVRTERPKPEFVDELITTEKLDKTLPQADFVAICLPGGPQTEHFFNKSKFELMKTSAVVMNIGRGTIIQQDHLVEALNTEVIGGALIDVTDPEPLPETSPLWDAKNIFITPHHSGLSEQYLNRAVDRLCLNIKAFLTGEKLPNEVNKELGY